MGRVRDVSRVPRAALPAGLVVVILAVLVALVWPRYVEERERAIDAGRQWVTSSLPAVAAVRARVEAQPTMHGWRVVYRGVNVPCTQTSMGCRLGPSQTDESLVYRDAWVCVEYGTGRAYFFGVLIRPAGPVGPNTCRPVSPSASAGG